MSRAEAHSVPMPGPGDQRRGGLVHEWSDDRVEFGDLSFEGLGPAGEHAQGELGERDDVAACAGPVRGGALEEPVDVEVPQVAADHLWGGGDDGPHLVQCLGSGLAGREPCRAQNPHGFDVAVSGFGLALRVTGLCCPSSGDGVLGIALASPAAPLAVGAVHLNHPHTLGMEMTDQPGSVAAGALDTDQLHLAEAAQPAHDAAVARSRGRE